jgi:hypothetical protein
VSTTLPRTAYWSDPAWRHALEEQLADELERLRLLFRRRIAWVARRTGRPPLQDATAWSVTEGEVAAALVAPDPAAELEFQRCDPEAARLGSEAEGLRAQIAERARVLESAGTPLPIDRLSDAFGLDEFERDTLMLALAPQLDAGFERACAFAHDDATRRYATPALAVALFGADGRAAGALHPQGPLTRWAILSPGEPGDAASAVRPLRIDPRVASYLRGIDHGVLPEGLFLQRLRQVPIPGELLAAAIPVVRVLARTLGTPAAGLPPPPVVNLVSGSAGQAAALAAAIGAGVGRTLQRVRLDARAERNACLSALERESVLRESLLLLHGPEAESDAAAEPLTELLEALRAPALLWSAYPVRLERPMVVLHLPKPHPAAARQIWLGSIGEGDAGVEETIDRIVHHFQLDPDGVARVVSVARGTARLAGRPVAAADLWSACREHGRRRLGGLAERIEPCCRWDDLVVPADVLRQLEEIAVQVRHRAEVYERWRFGDQLARGRGVTALFSGPSGTGKTMAAEVLAAELELDLYRIDLAGVVSKYIGETEKNLRRIFAAAEESGAILFFDEADALFGKRTEVRDSHDRYANIEVNYLLQRMESYTGLAILATNRRASLDRAFLRRLRFLVEFPFPTTASRLRIWQRAIPDAAPRAGIDFAALARMELAGGNIRSIAVNAAFLAAADGKVITMEHLAHAADREHEKLDQTPARSDAPVPQPARAR